VKELNDVTIIKHLDYFIIKKEKYQGRNHPGLDPGPRSPLINGDGIAESMDPISIVIFIAILLFSVIFHEVAHGLVADRLGDPTARYAGRLTLNPIPHIDLFGSILLPLFLILVNSPILFGAAKPVPVDYRNLRNLKRDMILVSVAGPLTNFILAVLAALVYRFVPNISSFGEYLLLQTVILNLVLALFNLIPIPPLDGSKILASLFGFLDRSWMYSMLAMERFGFIILIIFLFTGLVHQVLIPPLRFFLELLLGTNISL
jgi:Zn-dependent protease